MLKTHEKNPMKLVAEFTVEDLPKMTNAFNRQHWTHKYKENIKWKRLISDQCQKASISGLGLNSAVLTFTRHSTKAPDYDGLVSCFKPITDALVKCGVLVDDNMSIIGVPTFKWEYRAREQGGMITIRIET